MHPHRPSWLPRQPPDVRAPSPLASLDHCRAGTGIGRHDRAQVLHVPHVLPLFRAETQPERVLIDLHLGESVRVTQRLQPRQLLKRDFR